MPPPPTLARHRNTLVLATQLRLRGGITPISLNQTNGVRKSKDVDSERRGGEKNLKNLAKFFFSLRKLD